MKQSQNRSLKSIVIVFGENLFYHTFVSLHYISNRSRKENDKKKIHHHLWVDAIDDQPASFILVKEHLKSPIVHFYSER